MNSRISPFFITIGLFDSYLQNTRTVMRIKTAYKISANLFSGVFISNHAFWNLNNMIPILIHWQIFLDPIHFAQQCEAHRKIKTFECFLHYATRETTTTECYKVCFENWAHPFLLMNRRLLYQFLKHYRFILKNFIRIVSLAANNGKRCYK